MSKDETCPGCGAKRFILAPVVWECGRTSETVGVESMGCLIRQLAQQAEIIKTLRENLAVYDIDCPRAKSDMTPCVARDGRAACDDDGKCIGCGHHPADLLAAIAPKYVKAKEVYERMRALGAITGIGYQKRR